MAGGTMLAILRIVSGLLFLQHGAQKFLSFPPGPMAGIGLQFNSMGAYAGVVELVCGLLIVIGLFTRVVAFILSGEMAVAYFMAHFPNSPIPIVNQGEQVVLEPLAGLLAGPVHEEPVRRMCHGDRPDHHRRNAESADAPEEPEQQGQRADGLREDHQQRHDPGQADGAGEVAHRP